ncbi:MAG: TolC family protein [Acidobacteria bacterium]|nr:MAG: TolC family protein [Acidobacteriota bacterium]
MRSGRTLLAILTLSWWLTAWPAPGAAQTQADVGVTPRRPGAPVEVAGLILPPSALQPAGRPVRHLSVEEAVTLALEQNLDLRVERLNPLIQDLGVAEARSVYAPILSTRFMSNNRNSPSNGFLSGAGDAIKVTDRLLSDSVDVEQAVPWAGGRYSLSWDGSHSSTTSIFSSFDPILRSNLNVTYNQPLLRNLSIDGPRQQIAIMRANREISDIQLRRTVVLTQRNVRNAYWVLVFTQSFLEVQRQSLELAQESLRNNRTRVDVGTMAPIDIIEAESEVARNEETVIVAEADVDRAEDRLRTLIFDPDIPDFWSVRIQPSDSPILQARAIDVDAAVRNALDNRTDLDTLDRNIQTTDTNIRYYRNQRLPDVNLDVNYSLTGIGGTFLRRDDFLGPVISTEQTSFGSVLGNIFSNDFPTWTVGVTVAYPLGTSSAKANLERARLERTQADVNRRSLEMRIAAEVRDAGRNVTTNLQRVEATRSARQLAERRLEAEQRRFEVGLSTSFFVFQAQRDLASARSNEQRAILDYTRSLVDFDAVQDVPLFGTP